MIKKTFLFSLFSITLLIAVAFLFPPLTKAEITANSGYCDFTPTQGGLTGDVTINRPCVVYESVNGSVNGNLNIGTSATITLYRDMVWSPGSQLNLANGGLLYVMNGARILEAKICYKDINGNGIPAGTTISGGGSSSNVGPSGENLQTAGSTLTQIDATVSGSGPNYTCPAPYNTYRTGLSTITAFDPSDSTVSSTAFSTNDNEFLRMGFSINGVTDANAAAGDIVVGSNKNLIITPSGKLGIGITSGATPAQMIDVASTSNTNIKLNSGTGLASSMLSYNGSTFGSGFALFPASDTRAFGVYKSDFSNATMPFVVLQNGNVGIGTTNPVSPLQIGTLLGLLDGGNPSLSNNAYYSSGWKYTTSSYASLIQQTGTGNIDFYTAATGTAGNAIAWGTQKMTLLNNGNVGIGTTNPTSKLHVNGNLTIGSRIDFDGPYIDTQAANRLVLNATNYTYIPSGVFYVQNSSILRGPISNDGAAYVQINGGTSGYTYINGSLGIGTASPGAPLEADANAALTQRWRYSGGGSYYLDMNQVVTGGNVRWSLDLTNNGTSYPNQLVFNTGLVGIGTTAPTQKLDVYGAIAADTLESRSGADPLEINYYTGAPTKICGAVSCAVGSSTVFSSGYIIHNRAFPAYSNWQTADWGAALSVRALGANGMANANDSNAPIEVVGATSYQGAYNNTAHISFHRPGVYGANFGLDNDNQFSTQGWSAGSGYTGMKVGNLTVNGNISLPSGNTVDGVEVSKIVARRYHNMLVRNPIFVSSTAGWQVTGSASNPYINFNSWPVVVLSGTSRRYQVDVGWSGGGTNSNQNCIFRTFGHNSGAYYPGTIDVYAGYPWANNAWQVNTRILSNGTTDPYLYRVDLYVQQGGIYNCWVNYTDFVAEDSVDGSDYAEDVESYQNLLKGDIVSIDTDHDTAIVVSNKPYESKLAGVVSTEPGINIGKVRVGGKPFPLAIGGRVPTKVTNTSGPIHRGDILTSSNIQGTGMKATKAGPTIGKAYEEFDCQSYTNCRDISKVEYWVDKDSQQVDPTKAKDKIYPVAKIVILLNMSWYDPDVFLTSINGFEVKLEGPLAKVINSTGEEIDRVGIYGSAVIGHLKAGIIEAKKLILDGQDIATEISKLKERISLLESEVKLLKNK